MFDAELVKEILVLSHNYFNLNADAIFLICRDEIPQLQTTIEKMIEELS